MSSTTRRRTRMRVAAATAAVVVGVFGVGACGDDSDDAIADVPPLENEDTGGGAGDTSPPAEDSALAEITIADFSFTGATATPGAPVPITNTGATTHTVTADDGEFDAGRIASGATAEITAPNEPRTYSYHCEIHGTMQGTLTVA